MTSNLERIQQLQAAIAAQEALRATLGDAVVDTTIAALRSQLDPLLQREPALQTEQLLARLIPKELADKMRATGRIEGERKQASVMFADLSSFTAVAEQLDPEVVRGLQEDLLPALASAVYQYEGYIDKFLGDAIMAIFGAPIAHEDDPERALRAALAMRERMDALNSRWSARLGHTLALHIGINTGTVIVGEIGSEAGFTYTVTGDIVNTASRLQNAAEPGQILVSRSTYRLTSEAFQFQPLDPISVKGKREPLPVYGLLRARLNPGKARGLQGLRSPLVGREREMELLRGVVASLLGGQGRIVTIEGEAGLGKSRLIREWRAGAGERVRWLEGRAFAHTTGMAYGPFIDMFRRYAEIQDDDSESQARRRLDAAVTRLFGPDRDAHALFASMIAMRPTAEESEFLAALPAQQLREQLFAKVASLLEHFAQQRPIVLVIEDMHWADATSLELLEHLLPLVERTPLAIVGVFREQPDVANNVFLRAAQARYADRLLPIRLAPLSESASLAMVSQLLSLPDLPASLRQLIVAKAEGNPFFVEEVIRTLIERGALMHSARNGADGRWVATPLIERISVPDTLQGLLAARLDRLPDETKRVAQLASVIGRVFPYRVLLKIAESHASLEADLVHLEREDLIRERAREPELEYIFKHALTQDVAYQSLLTPRRRELHRRVGEAMESLFGQRISEFSSIIGQHFLHGEQWDKAAARLIEAGDGAARLFANAEAREHYANALDALQHLPDTPENRSRHIDTTVKLVSSSWIAYVPEENLSRLEAEAQSLATTSLDSNDNQLRLARIYYWMGRLRYVLNDSRAAIGYYQQVLSIARQFGDEELLAIPSSVIGQALTVQGQFGKAAAYLQQAIPALEKTGNVYDWIRTLGFYGVTLTARGQYAAGVAEGERALARARAIKNVSATAALHVYLSFVHLVGGDAPSAIDHGGLAVETAGQSGDRVLVYAGYGFAAWGRSRLAEHEAAMALMQQAQDVAHALGGRIILANWFAAAKAEIEFNAGQVAGALAQAEQVVLAAKKGGDLYGEGVAQRVWALALASGKQFDEAGLHILASIQAFETGECLAEVARTQLAWGRFCLARGARTEAREHAEAAARQFSGSGMFGDLQQANALLQQLA